MMRFLLPFVAVATSFAGCTASGDAADLSRSTDLTNATELGGTVDLEVATELGVVIDLGGVADLAGDPDMVPVPPAKPDPPVLLSADPLASGARITFSLVSAAVKYDVFIYDEAGNFVAVWTTTESPYEWTGGDPCVKTTYRYRVVAVASTGVAETASDPSNELSATTMPVPLGCWTQTHTAGLYVGVSAHNSVVLLVTWDGRVRRSTDGGASFGEFTTIGGRADGIAYGLGRFLVSTNEGILASTDDGVTFTLVTPSIANAPVHFVNGRFFVGAFTSTDGTTFVGTNLSAAPRQIAYGLGQYFAAIDQKTVATSTDGVTFTESPFAGGAFLYSDEVLTGVVAGTVNDGTAKSALLVASNYGRIWYQVAAASFVEIRSGTGTLGAAMRLATDGTKFVALGSGLLVSDNGYSWPSDAAALPNGRVLFPRWFGFAGGKYFYVGFEGMIQTSNDGKAWDLVETDTSIKAMTRSGSALLACGTGHVVLRSIDDGATWSWRTVGDDGSDRLQRIAANGSTVVTGDASGRVFRSLDGGDTFTEVSSSFVGYGLAGADFGLVYAAGLFVTSAGKTVVTSDDGLTWTPRLTLTEPVDRGPLFANGVFLVTSLSGGVYTSANGTDWTTRAGLGEQATYMTAANNRFFVTLSSNARKVSTDGVSWSPTGGDMMPFAYYAPNYIDGLPALSPDLKTLTYPLVLPLDASRDYYSTEHVFQDGLTFWAWGFNGSLRKSVVVP